MWCICRESCVNAGNTYDLTAEVFASEVVDGRVWHLINFHVPDGRSISTRGVQWVGRLKQYDVVSVMSRSRVGDWMANDTSLRYLVPSLV